MKGFAHKIVMKDHIELEKKCQKKGFQKGPFFFLVNENDFSKFKNFRFEFSKYAFLRNTIYKIFRNRQKKTQDGREPDPKKTGSLYGLSNIAYGYFFCQDKSDDG